MLKLVLTNLTWTFLVLLCSAVENTSRKKAPSLQKFLFAHEYIIFYFHL